MKKEPKQIVVSDSDKKRLRELAPRDELEEIIREATQSVEDMLRLEDQGWQSLTGQTGEVITGSARVANLKLSRLYAIKDPLGKQSVRLWTDYTFGMGLTWQSENEQTQKVLEAFWDNPENKSVLSARGQRKSSDKLLIDGDVFFALFLGSKDEARIRFIDPLEITEIITDPDDIDKVFYYRRDWADLQGETHTDYYRDYTNIKDEKVKDSADANIQKTQEALIYYLNYNTTTQRGNPLLLPALDWIKQYRRFLASRIAVMLALARFAWKNKIAGSQAIVDTIKATTHGKEIAAGSILLENMGSDTTPIKADSGAKGAYQDAKMIKYQVCAAVGIPEQYFGDISTGNLATAKTVELPMMKMFQSYQAIWLGAYKDINEIVLAHAGINKENWYVDMDFPKIAPADVAQAAEAIVGILGALPELGVSDDVKQIALMTLGVNDPADVLAQLTVDTKEAMSNPEVALLKVLIQVRESLKEKEKA